jgi:dihydroorotase
MLTLIKNAQLVNEGRIYKADVLIEDKIIKQIATEINIEVEQIIDAEGLHLIPGVIDDQVHFREPGLTHKANIYTESKAAIAGGITSFMEAVIGVIQMKLKSFFRNWKR